MTISETIRIIPARINPYLSFESIYSFTKIALTCPSWLGRFVIFALPREVSIIVPLVKRFCLAWKTLCGVSRTFLISAFCVFFVSVSKTFAVSAFRRMVFLFPPLTLRVFLFVFFNVTILS